MFIIIPNVLTGGIFYRIKINLHVKSAVFVLTYIFMLYWSKAKSVNDGEVMFLRYMRIYNCFGQL